MAWSGEILYMECALLCAGVAAFTDLRSRRIPNWLTGPALLGGLLLHLAIGGPLQALWALLSGFIAGAVFLVFFLAGGMGAGDVKLISALATIAGLASVRDLLLSTVIAGALFALVFAALRGQLRHTLRNVVTLIGHHQTHGLEPHAELNVRNGSNLRLPYALPIAAGCGVTLCLQLYQGASL